MTDNLNNLVGQATNILSNNDDKNNKQQGKKAQPSDQQSIDVTQSAKKALGDTDGGKHVDSAGLPDLVKGAFSKFKNGGNPIVSAMGQNMMASLTVAAGAGAGDDANSGGQAGSAAGAGFGGKSGASVGSEDGLGADVSGVLGGRPGAFAADAQPGKIETQGAQGTQKTPENDSNDKDGDGKQQPVQQSAQASKQSSVPEIKTEDEDGITLTDEDPNNNDIEESTSAPKDGSTSSTKQSGLGGQQDDRDGGDSISSTGRAQGNVSGD